VSDEWESAARRGSVRITAIYVAVALTWILFSDQLLELLAVSATTLTHLQTIKGGLFVLVTGALLYLLIHRQLWQLHRHEAQVERLNRIYHILSGINGTLLRVRERDTLLQEACRIATGSGGYRFVLVATLEQERDSLRVEASAGHGDGFAAETMLQRQRSCPAWLAVESGKPQMGSTGDSRLDATWRRAAASAGFRAVAAFPLEQGGEITGVMVFCSEHADVFIPAEMRLLAEVAADTGLGLEHIGKSDQVEWLATHDPLTGLPNRNLMTDRLEQAIRRSHENHHCVGILILNIHQFHHINDAFGRDTGDHVLRTVGHTITTHIDGENSVARIGSDEFVVLLDQAENPDAIEAAASQLLRAFPLRVQHGEQDIFIHVRGGGAIAPADGKSAAHLLERAEIALHGSSREAQNHCTFYGREVDEAMRRRHLIVQELQGALEREEFHLLYQPIIRLDDSRVAGAETLLRWQNRQMGMVGPGEFIPIAEESGQIDTIGAWILAAGCRQHRAWLESGHNIGLTINVSARQLLAPDFSEQLEAQLIPYAPEERPRLGLEITETDLLRDMERAVEVLAAVHRKGVQVYLDDFGTGYSSLAYLNRLPVDKVKIDGSFVADLPDDKGSYALVQSIIGMAHSMQLEVVAEGVETPEQLQILHALHCDAVQGYLFARPMPAARLTPLLEIPASRW